MPRLATRRQRRVSCAVRARLPSSDLRSAGIAAGAGCARQLAWSATSPGCRARPHIRNERARRDRSGRRGWCRALRRSARRPPSSRRGEPPSWLRSACRNQSASVSSAARSGPERLAHRADERRPGMPGDVDRRRRRDRRPAAAMQARWQQSGMRAAFAADVVPAA